MILEFPVDKLKISHQNTSSSFGLGIDEGWNKIKYFEVSSWCVKN